LEAYRALFDLKKEGKVKAVGVGAKNWKMVRRIATDVSLDWVMIANSLTVKSHPKKLLDFMAQLKRDGVTIINAAVFHSGFLVGGNYFDYKPVIPGTKEGDELYKWRSEFFAVCHQYDVKPAAACVQFGLYAPGVQSIALSTTEPKRVKENVDLVNAVIPAAFWEAMLEKGLIGVNFFKNTIFSEAK
jgi:D-threo-aldose 1-dehydrogenase